MTWQAALDANKDAMSSLKLSVDESTTSTYLKAKLRESLAAREKQLAKRLKEIAAQATDQLAAGQARPSLTLPMLWLTLSYYGGRAD